MYFAEYPNTGIMQNVALPLEVKMLFSIKKFDDKTSLYFFSNSDLCGKSLLELSEKFSALIILEKKIHEFEELLRGYKELSETLEKEVLNL
jgi:hypothetical protein